MVKYNFDTFYVNTFSASFQFSYMAQENSILALRPFGALVGPSSFCAEGSFQLFFVISSAFARLDIARALFIFNKIFFVKPKIRRCKGGNFKIYADLPLTASCQFLGLLLNLKKVLNSKFVRLSVASSGVSLTLHEPLTFFPLLHPSFDYHDWRYPFRFHLSFRPRLHGYSNNSSETFYKHFVITQSLILFA